MGGARRSAIPLGLLTVAALLPAMDLPAGRSERGQCQRCRFRWADLVMTGGMNVQRPDCLALIARARNEQAGGRSAGGRRLGPCLCRG